MSKDEQIEEMAKLIYAGRALGKSPTEVALVLRHAGYRKIPTTDWLTKGVSQEQIEREKEDAFAEVAERLGYRKQSEGEWKICSDGYYPYCSECKNEPKMEL